jgi:hypothetical protein
VLAGRVIRPARREGFGLDLNQALRGGDLVAAQREFAYRAVGQLPEQIAAFDGQHPLGARVPVAYAVNDT